MQANSIAQAVLFFCLMVYAAYKDIRKREIPPFIWISLSLISIIDFKLINIFGILAALPLLFIAVWIAPDRLGGGDIKFVGAAGLVLGLQKTNLGMIIGLTLQVCVFITYSLYKKIKKEEARNLSMPLAPCLSIGFLVIYFMKLGGIIHELI